MTIGQPYVVMPFCVCPEFLFANLSVDGMGMPGNILGTKYPGAAFFDKKTIAIPVRNDGRHFPRKKEKMAYHDPDI